VLRALCDFFMATRPMAPATRFQQRLPNLITAVRFALLPCVAWAFLRGDRGATFGLLAAIAISDWLDGFLARRWNASSALGAVLDPIADKLAQVTLLVLLAWGGRAEFGIVPRWFVALVIGRDLFLVYGALRVRARLGRVAIKARWQGKLSTLLVFGILFAALVPAPQAITDLIAWVTAPIVVSSAVRYYLDGLEQARRAEITESAEVS